MNDTIIKYNTSILAKEKEFDEPVIYRYDSNHELIGVKMGMHGNPNYFLDNYSAPTQSLLQKWLREKYDVHMLMKPFFDSIGKDTFVCDVIRRVDGRVIKSTRCDTYEEAFEKGLVNGLNLIK